MKILVTTSNNYSFLLETYAHLFNKYWANQEIIFLGFNEPQNISLPSNCSFHSLGKQEDFGTIWTDPLIPFIESLEDEYFMVTVEDMMLVSPVNLEKMALMETEIKNGDADKAVLDRHLNSSSLHYKPGLRKLGQYAEYRTTLHPSIWRKEYFQRYLKPGYTAWDFELKNMGESYTDRATIITPDGDENVFEALNVYRKGVPIPRTDCPSPYGCHEDAIVDMKDIEMILSCVREHENEASVNEL